MKDISAFELMDCALITLATGKQAMNLRELRDRIAEVDDSSLYYHFYENLLRPSFDDPEYRNDFALWARQGLNQPELAEKLMVLDPMGYHDLSELRQNLLDVVEDYLAEHEYVPWARFGQEFYFLTSRVVVFDTGKRFKTLEELAQLLPSLSTGSIFYHFIDAQRRPPLNMDDFSAWSMQWGEATAGLRQELAGVDYYFCTLPELRQRLIRAVMKSLAEEASDDREIN
ncbi:MAG: hypothetical protein F9K51_04455 [Candidatus Dadabacteria bacterium]|nr:MAG: hypothetical protein F9K51_04455 [Candidatus Dadabacteria bacterium]